MTSASLDFLQYCILVDHIERVCHAADMLGTETEEALKKIELKDTSVVTRARAANERLDLILKEVFAQRELTAPLKVGRNDKPFEEVEE